MQVIILTEQNIKDILELESESGPGEPYYADYSENELQDLFKKPEECQAFGIFENNKLIAWSTYRRKEDNLYAISSLVVSKDYRGKGLGKALLKHVIKAILDIHKDTEIYLTVYPQNLDALFLYLKNNFVIYDFKKDYYGPGADRLFLKYKKH